MAAGVPGGLRHREWQHLLAGQVGRPSTAAMAVDELGLQIILFQGSQEQVFSQAALASKRAG